MASSLKNGAHISDYKWTACLAMGNKLFVENVQIRLIPVYDQATALIDAE